MLSPQIPADQKTSTQYPRVMSFSLPAHSCRFPWFPATWTMSDHITSFIDVSSSEFLKLLFRFSQFHIWFDVHGVPKFTLHRGCSTNARKLLPNFNSLPVGRGAGHNLETCSITARGGMFGASPAQIRPKLENMLTNIGPNRTEVARDSQNERALFRPLFATPAARWGRMVRESLSEGRD